MNYGIRNLFQGNLGFVIWTFKFFIDIGIYEFVQCMLTIEKMRCKILCFDNMRLNEIQSRCMRFQVETFWQNIWIRSNSQLCIGNFEG